MAIERFKEWMAASSVAEKKELAIKARTSLNMLYQLGSENRNASSDLAGKIESGIASINRRKRHTPLPDVRRGDLSVACSKCRFYKECE